MTLAQPLQLLMQARDRYTQREIAEYVGKDIKTVRRWEKGETPCPAMLEPALRNLLQSPASTTGKPGSRFRVIDLFAGIGGIRMGFEAHGGECSQERRDGDREREDGEHHPQGRAERRARRHAEDVGLD